jgi:nitrogen fixation/metabolism regulation signal transduction histidine kinase
MLRETRAISSFTRRRARARRLALVRRRVEDTGGRLEIATRTDGGTRSQVVVPVR